MASMQDNKALIKTFVEAQRNNQGRSIPFFTALPGVGKTAVVQAVAEELDALYIPWIGAIHDPCEYQMPVVTEGRFTFEPGPEFVRANEVAKSGKLVVFHFDEFSTMMPAQQNAALTILSEGRVGSMMLHPNVTFVVTQNPLDATLAGTPLSPAMANRAQHVPWFDPTAREWGEWLVARRPEGSDAFKRSYAFYAAGVAEFVKTVPDLLHAMPEDDEARSGAWASPRSWESAVLVLAMAKANGLADGLCKLMVESSVGEDATSKVWEYLIKSDLPKPEDILAGRDSLPVDGRMDKLLISINSLAQAAMETRDDRTERVITALEAAEPAARTQLDYIKVAFKGAFAAEILQPAWASKKLNPRLTKVLAGPLAALAEAQATTDKA